MAQASRDQNFVPTLLGVSNVDGSTPVRIYADPVTHRLLVDLAGGGSGWTVETPTGTVDASNDTFAVSSEPVCVIADGMTYFDGAGYTYAAPNVVMDIAPSQFIRAFLD